MDYDELIRNIRKSGLSIKEFGYLIKTNPNSITNLRSKGKIPKNLAIIAVLLGELVDKDIPYEHLFEKLGLEEQKRKLSKETKKNLFKKKDEK